MIETLIEKLAELKELSERQHMVESMVRSILLSGNYRVDLPCAKHVVVQMPDLVGGRDMDRVLRMLHFLAGKEVTTCTCDVILTERGVFFEKIIGRHRLVHKLVSATNAVAESLNLYEVIILLVLAKRGILEGVIGDVLRFAEEEIRHVFKD
jgi:hypothetical protein